MNSCKVLQKSANYRLVHVAEDFSKASGGVPAVVYELSGKMAKNGIETHVVCSHYEPMQPALDVELHYVPPTGIGRYWYWGKGMLNELEDLSRSSDSAIFHIHGVWSAPQYLASKVAYAEKLPSIISTHGMLEPWLWNCQGLKVLLKKKLYWALMASRVYNQASILHAITPLERDHLSQLVPNVPIEIIPNAVDISKYGYIELNQNREKIILFLGRIDPKKGVDILIKAFFAASLTHEWRLIIAGPSWSDIYMKYLKELVVAFKLENRVDFIGSIFGEEKISLLKKVWVLAVPSYSEVVGLVNLEAALYGLPTITTHETGLFDWNEGGGLLISPNVEQLTSAIIQVSSWSDAEHKSRGEGSLDLVRKKYSWDVVEPMWCELYQQVAGRL